MKHRLLYAGALIAAAHGIHRYNSVLKATLSNHQSSTPGSTVKLSDSLPSVIESKADQSAHYTWVGNTFIPPTGVPRYSTIQLKNIYKHVNTLWFGDSNARQDFMTLVKLVSPEYNNTNDVSVRELDKDINLNKGKVSYTCKHRDFSNKTVLGQWTRPTIFFCFHSSDNTNDTAKFDYAPGACPQDVRTLMRHERNSSLVSLLQDYNAIVVDFGIWEIMRNWDCRAWNQSESTVDRMENVLKQLYQFSSSRFQVYWKTTGRNAQSGNKDSQLNEMNNHIRQWFNQTSPKYMHLVDFEEESRPRSRGESRIEGDLDPHWGLEARLLTIQMVTHAIVQSKSDIRFVH